MKIVLSSRELTALRMLADSMGDEELAKGLHVRKETVEALKRQLFRKVGVNDPVQALHLLARNGFTLED